MTSLLLAERDGAVLTLTLNRPDRLNALNPDLTAELFASLDEAEAAFPEIRVVILTGAGRGFCSGVDVSVMARRFESDGPLPNVKHRTADLGPKLRMIPQPIIAAVNGPVAGAGLSLALASDVRLCAPEAGFTCAFVKRGLVPDTGASYTLTKVIGPGLASEMALTGDTYDAQWALRAGLVNDVVPSAELLPRALELAERITSNPPLVVAAIKQTLDLFAVDLAEVVAAEMEANALHADSEDRREAMLAFMEKRRPVFRGR